MQKVIENAKKQTEKRLKRLQEERKREEKEDARNLAIIKKGECHSCELEKKFADRWADYAHVKRQH